MGSIAIKKSPAEPAPLATPMAWEPARLMRRLLDWDPFREMTPFTETFPVAASFLPSFDVKETKEAYVFKADVPGVKENELEVTLTGNRLTISGKREAEKEEQSDRFYTYERSFGSFSRAFTLPDGVDAERVLAELKEGVLTVSLPKKPEMQAKKIAIGTPPPAGKA